MAKHTATVTVNAPMDQTYKFWSHFNDYPKFMSFVKEVTYIDDQRSHWVVDLLGHHEWDAVNEGWVPNQSIGWRSTDGLENAGKVNFRGAGLDQTQVEVNLNYDPPAGFLGDVGEALGGGSRVQDALEHDLNNFAKMVEQAGPGALDPESSNYLFHADSAAAKGETTKAQNQSMQVNPSQGSQEGFRETVQQSSASAPRREGTDTYAGTQGTTGASTTDTYAETDTMGAGKMGSGTVGSGTAGTVGAGSTGASTTMGTTGTSMGTGTDIGEQPDTFTSGSAYTETGAGREDQMAPEGYGGSEVNRDIDVDEEETVDITGRNKSDYSS